MSYCNCDGCVDYLIEQGLNIESKKLKAFLAYFLSLSKQEEWSTLDYLESFIEED